MIDNEQTDIYYYHLEPISAAFSNNAWSYSAEDEREQAASRELQGEIETEYGLPVGFTSVGTGAAEPGFLVLLPSAVISGALWLFFQGEKIQPNIDAWKKLYDKYFIRLARRKPSFDRGGATILAILALTERLGHDPKSLHLVSYSKRSNRMDTEDVVAGVKGQIDDRMRIERATIHIFVIEADGKSYEVHVFGDEVTFHDG